MSDERLTEAAWALIQAASEPITYPVFDGHRIAVVPVAYLEQLEEALGPPETPAMRPESDWFRGDAGELIEVRYLDIPDLPSGEIDEIVCGPVHMETLDANHAYLRVAGLMVNVWATDGGRLSITCEPDDCTPIAVPPTEQGGAS